MNYCDDEMDFDFESEGTLRMSKVIELCDYQNLCDMDNVTNKWTGIG